MKKILITGAAGQIGSELVSFLVEIYGRHNIVATDIKKYSGCLSLDCLDRDAVRYLVAERDIGIIYHLAAILSAKAENDPETAINVNNNGLYNILEAARKSRCRVFVPSSIAVFSPGLPVIPAPQESATRPDTIYGMTKAWGEMLCDYYVAKYGLDIRGIRYPGLISSATEPGGGTTDYAVDIFYQAVKTGHYTCFLKKNTRLPMMYMPDAIRATVQLMSAPKRKLRFKNAYNLAAFSFTPEELARAIKKHIPEFRIAYKPDSRQKIADSWPETIDDSRARLDWCWRPRYDFATMVADMVSIVKNKPVNGGN
ncbi:MAG: NAD-dependent epimerase/dehydratase family protein [Candidatus Falkowbacteria bacterium]